MADKEGRGGMDTPFLADIICEQPLKNNQIAKPLCYSVWFRKRKTDKFNYKLRATSSF